MAWAWGSGGGEYIYATLGNDTRNFQHYSLWDDNWSDGPYDLPEEVGDESEGRSLSYVWWNADTNYIYCLIGGYTNLFYRYYWRDDFAVNSGGMANLGVKISSNSLTAKPNPFLNNVTIVYSINEADFISLKIYDAQGKLIKTLTEDRKEPGSYNMRWDRKDDDGKKVSSGVYFLNLTTKNQRLKNKLILR